MVIESAEAGNQARDGATDSFKIPVRILLRIVDAVMLPDA